MKKLSYNSSDAPTIFHGKGYSAAKKRMIYTGIALIIITILLCMIWKIYFTLLLIIFYLIRTVFSLNAFPSCRIAESCLEFGYGRHFTQRFSFAEITYVGIISDYQGNKAFCFCKKSKKKLMEYFKKHEKNLPEEVRENNLLKKDELSLAVLLYIHQQQSKSYDTIWLFEADEEDKMRKTLENHGMDIGQMTGDGSMS